MTEPEAIKKVVRGSNPMDYVLSRTSSEDLGDRLLQLKEFVEGKAILRLVQQEQGFSPMLHN
ncbi:hypothetical protein HYU19_05620 [Candidatus Woesearchaeota archaeon]|nr:hypothetical protein [Candidatus Woesearchaeota archaeon]